MTLESDRLLSQIVELTGRLVDEYAAVGAGLGVTFDPPQIDRAGPDVEVSVYVRRNGNIEDVVEFFALQRGLPTNSLTDLERWLRATLDDVLRRAVDAL